MRRAMFGSSLDDDDSDLAVRECSSGYGLNCSAESGPNAPEPCLVDSWTLVALDSVRSSVEGAGEGERTSVL